MFMHMYGTCTCTCVWWLHDHRRRRGCHRQRDRHSQPGRLCRRCPCRGADAACARWSAAPHPLVACASANAPAPAAQLPRRCEPPREFEVFISRRSCLQVSASTSVRSLSAPRCEQSSLIASRYVNASLVPIMNRDVESCVGSRELVLLLRASYSVTPKAVHSKYPRRGLDVGHSIVVPFDPHFVD